MALYVVVLCLSLVHIGQLQQCTQTHTNRLDVSLNKQNCNMTSQYQYNNERNGCNVVINGQCTNGLYSRGQCVMTEESLRDKAPRWTVDLEQEYTIQRITVTGRRESFGLPRTTFTVVWVDDVMVYKYPATVPTNITTDISRSTPGSGLPAKGRLVSLSRTENNYDFDGERILLTFCKLEVWVCRPGHHGENCTSCGPSCTDQFCDEINNPCSGPCNPSTCQNGGTCTADYSVNYTCTCPPGVTGAQCQTDNRPCTVNRTLCQNNGTCVNSPRGTSYTCVCTAGYTGRNCHTAIDECSSQPCVNGTCHDRVYGYSCACFAGYEGTQCNQDINECISSPCGNGYCNNTEGSYVCYCNPGYSGPSCTNEVTGTQNRCVGLLTGLIVGAILGAVTLIGLCVVIGICYKRRVTQSGRGDKSTTVTGNSSLSTTTSQHSEDVVYANSQDVELEPDLGSTHEYDRVQYNADDGLHTYCRLQTPEPSARKH